MNKGFLRPLVLLILLLCCSLLLGGCPLTDDAAPQTPAATPMGDDLLVVRFLDVGQADAALLMCGEDAMLIDGGNVDDSDRIVAVLKAEGLDHLDTVICTHAHEDHVGGLAGALSYATAETVYAPVTEYDTAAFGNFKKAAEKQGLELTLPQPDESFSLGGAVVEILGPRQEYEDTNNTSIVVKVSYGEMDFLFTGDMEKDAEQDLIDAGCDLSAEVLKVGHHGSETSSSYVFLREVMPSYGVISCGVDNSYGHPHEEPLSRLRDAGVQLYRTDLQGDIRCESDGSTLVFSVDKGADKDTNPTAPQSRKPEAGSYIGNLRSQKYHLESCDNLPQEENRTHFSSREEAEEAGYSPCGNCKP